MQLDDMWKQRRFKGITVYLAAWCLYFRICVKLVLCASSYVAVSVLSVQNIPWVGPPKLFLYLAQKYLKPAPCKRKQSWCNVRCFTGI